MGSVRRAPCPKCRRTRCKHAEARRAPWEARFRDPAGNQRTRTFSNKADARAWLSTVETDVARGAWVDPALGRVTFNEYAEEWLETKADVSARTFINVEGRLKNHVLPAFGPIPLQRIQPSDVRAFVASLTRSG